MGWFAGHGGVANREDEGWSVSAATDALTRLGVHNAAAVIDELLTLGLLAAVDVADAGPFARRYRLAPLLLGLGNDPGVPASFAIGLPDRPMLVLARPMFAVWGRADAAADLWTACQEVADEQRQADDDRHLCNPSRILAEFLRSLHGLLQIGGGYLDNAQPRVEELHR
jgi:hypothetical protein